jgi:hypothetical protein
MTLNCQRNFHQLILYWPVFNRICSGNCRRESLEEALRERRAGILHLQCERENTGVELFAVQHILARLQESMTQVAAEIAGSEAEMLEAEDEIRAGREALAQEQM